MVASESARVWLLLGDKAGDNAQLRVLAAAMGCAWRELPLDFNGLYRIPNPLLGASLASLRNGRDSLGPPWPDLVLSSGRRTVPVARWIRSRSGGHTRLVHLGRCWAPLNWFDLVIAMPQYRVPAAANVVEAILPFNRLPADRLAREAERWAARVAHLPRPYVTVLVGGPMRPLRFGRPEAMTMARAASQLAARQGGSVLAISSRRSGKAVTSAFTANLTGPHLMHGWRRDDADNPYAAFLGLADRIIVSGDSASMLAEACRTGKPVIAAPLPWDLRPRVRLERTIDTLLSFGALQALQRHGLAVASRDMPGLLHNLATSGHIALLDQPESPTRSAPDDLPSIAARVRELLR